MVTASEPMIMRTKSRKLMVTEKANSLRKIDSAASSAGVRHKFPFWYETVTAWKPVLRFVGDCGSTDGQAVPALAL